jgi:hypothetical protein
MERRKKPEIFRQLTANNIELKEYPFIKELAMEAYLLENEDILKLDNSNFNDVRVLDAEIALKGGRKSSNRDGRIDILATYGMDYLAIIELKIDEINDETLSQLQDYLNEKDQLLNNHPNFWEENKNPPQWVGVLVGTSISPELQRKLQDGYVTEDNIPIAGMVIRRFRGQTNEIYVITDTFFKYNYTGRDFSKFEFKGNTYNKSRLVHKVLKSYVEENPNVTFAKLEKAFPNWIQGSMGVFTTKENAVAIFDNTGHKRYYINANEFIELDDETIASCTQWGIENITKFVDHVNEMDNDFKIISK